MKRKKFLGLVLALALVIGLMPRAHAVADPPATSATSTIVIDAYSGQVLYEDNADEQRPIASITKIMTAYLAVEDMTLDDARLDETYTISEHAAASDEGGTSMYFVAGDQVSMEVLLYGTMLRSGNDQHPLQLPQRPDRRGQLFHCPGYGQAGQSGYGK